MEHLFNRFYFIGNFKMEETNKKPYQKPKIIHETELEVRAGTVIPPLPGEDPFLDPLLDE